MLDIAAIATPGARLFAGGGGECSKRLAALCAAAIALALLIGGAWHTPAHADGGASARNQIVASAPDDSGATIQSYAQRILRVLADRHTNGWVRYWQARADCQAVPDAHDAAPLDRALLTLTASLCAQLAPRLGVNPADYSPRGEERTVGLLLNEPGAAVGYTLLTGHNDVFLIDPLGRVVHDWHHDWHMDVGLRHAKLLDSGSLLVNISPRIGEFDPLGNKIWEYKIDGLHHDFLKMPNGNVMMLVRGNKTRKEAIAAGANPEFVHKNGIEYDYLIEVQPTDESGGKVVWEWSAWDHLVQDFDPAKPNYGSIAEHPELIDINFLLETISKRSARAPRDWMHSNAIDYNPELDQIMLSPRNFSELWIIDHSATTSEARGHNGGNSGMGGDLLYRWGNPRAYGHGNADDQRLFWQHQTQWIPPGLPGAGNILVFNNGNEFPGDERHHSSIDEIAPPVDGYDYQRAEGAAYPPAKLEWTYAAATPADFYAPILSGAQRLPNGNTLIVDGPAGTMFKATPDGRIVWKYASPISNLGHLRQGEATPVRVTFPTPHGDPVPVVANSLYRAYWYPPDYAGLRALDLTPGAYIEDIPDIYDFAHKALIAGDFGERLASSRFDIYLDEVGDEGERRLIYFKQSCAADDAQRRFFLHITPSDARDLPAHRQKYGFGNRDFHFYNRGKASDGWCIAIAQLPRYPIQSIRTGQFTSTGRVWRADIDLGE